MELVKEKLAILGKKQGSKKERKKTKVGSNCAEY